MLREPVSRRPFSRRPHGRHGPENFEGFDEQIVAMYARGMTTRDIEAHLVEIYGASVGRDTISRVTAAVLEDAQAWQERPLEAVYPIVYLDTLVRHEALSDRAGCETSPLGCRSSLVKLRAA